MSDPAGRTKPRHIGGLLMLALLISSPIFVWLLLRKGYATSTRIAGFVFAAVMLALGLFRLFHL